MKKLKEVNSIPSDEIEFVSVREILNALPKKKVIEPKKKKVKILREFDEGNPEPKKKRKN